MQHRYEAFADKYLDVTLRSGAEWMCRCVFHENTGSAAMQFNVDRGLFICFGCDAKGGMKKLLAEFGLERVEESLDVTDILKLLRKIDKGKGEASLPVLEESYLNRYKFPTDYWEDRGFTPETIKLFGLGADPLDDVVTIPIRNMDAQLLGVIRRDNDPDTLVRYKYPWKFKRGDHMFASWLVYDIETTHVAVVEGATDAAMCWQAGVPALAQYGSTIGRRQILLMQQLGIEHVTLLYDNPAIDKAGKLAFRYAQGWHRTKDRKTGKYIEEYDRTTDLARIFQVDIGQYPTKPRRKDPGALTADQIKEAVAEAVPVV